MTLAEDALCVVLEGDLLGAHLRFNVQHRFAQTNRVFRKLYSVVWPLMWRARARGVRTSREAASLDAIGERLDQCSRIAEVRHFMCLAVLNTADKHLDALIDGALAAGAGEAPWPNLVDELFRPLIDGQTFLHIAVRMQVRGGSPARLAIVLLSCR
jgi:hypothetical protein